MWLFTRYGFYRVAWYGKEFGVCARMEHHLVALKRRFACLEPNGAGEILVKPEADYRYRIMVKRRVWVDVMSQLAQEQDWRKFKPEVERMNGHSDYYRACLEVWGVMYGVQCNEVNYERHAEALEREEAGGQDALDRLYEEHVAARDGETKA